MSAATNLSAIRRREFSISYLISFFTASGLSTFFLLISAYFFKALSYLNLFWSLRSEYYLLSLNLDMSSVDFIKLKFSFLIEACIFGSIAA